MELSRELFGKSVVERHGWLEKSLAMRHSRTCFLFRCFYLVCRRRRFASIKKPQKMPSGILFLSGLRLFLIKDLVGIAGGSMARNRINVAGKTPQAGSFANRWFPIMCHFNLRHRPYTVKSFLSDWSQACLHKWFCQVLSQLLVLFRIYHR